LKLFGEMDIAALDMSYSDDTWHLDVAGSDGGGGSASLAVGADGAAASSASGKLTGSFTSNAFTLTGNIAITVLGLHVNGTMKADDKGMVACSDYKGHGVGFEFDWAATDSVTHLGKTNYTETGF
jgi:hypothetical protein